MNSFSSGTGAGYGTHTLSAVRLDSTQAAELKALQSTNLEATFSAAGNAARVNRFALKLHYLDDGDAIAVIYIHGLDDGKESCILSDFLSHLDLGIDASIIEKFNSVSGLEQIFGWQHNYNIANDPGKQIGMVFAPVILDNEGADKLRKVVGKLKSTYISGFAERANIVGYLRESMALMPDGDGNWLYLLYLESKSLSGEELFSNTKKLRPNWLLIKFLLYWGPRYPKIIKGGEMNEGAGFDRTKDLILSWSQNSSRNSSVPTRL